MTTIKDLRTTIKKWLFLCDDTLIDVILATYLTNQKEGTPVWIFIIDNSGETKSELLRPLKCRPDTIYLDDLTKASFVSGKEGVNDLFTILKNKSRVIIIPDLAVLSSKRKEEKNEIWAKFRELYDGNLNKRTGTVVKEDCNTHVTILAGGTKNFRSQHIINNQLGTRELLYTPKQRSEYMQDKLNKALMNDNYETDMRKEIEKVVNDFLKATKLKKVQFNKETNNFLIKQVERLRIIRATADIDYYNGSIVGEIDIETPTRAIKQLKRLFEGLLSLDEKYPLERAKQIIERVVNSSGNQLRMEIIDVLDTSKNYREFSLAEISDVVKSDKKQVTTELLMLWKIGYIDRYVKQERIGSYQEYDPQTKTYYEKGGKVIDVPYYCKTQ